MLLLITVIAVATMSSSTFQTAMVVNAQQREYTFRSAESAAEQSLTATLLNSADVEYLKNGNNPAPYNVPAANLHAARADFTVTAKLYRMGNGAPPKNQSVGSGGAGFKVMTYVYESVGKAESSDKKEATQVAQGAAVLQPVPEGNWD